jgi:hypothetical protein
MEYDIYTTYMDITYTTCIWFIKSHVNYIYKHTKLQPNISIKIES